MPAFLAVASRPSGLDERDARGVVAAVLEPPQTLEHDVEGTLAGYLATDVADDSTHGRESTGGRPDGPERRPAPCVRHNRPRATRRSPRPRPYVDLDRDAWTRLSASTPLPLTDADVERLAGLGDPIDLAEVDAIYRPISRLLDLYIEATRGLHAASSTFLREDVGGTPFVIGVAGSVAVGKSTTARLLRELLARWPATPRVAARHHRRLPLPERRARAPRADGAQGLPGVVRPPRAAAVRVQGQGRPPRGPRARCTTTSPTTSSRAREIVVQPPRRAHRRGPQRAAARPPDGRGHLEPRGERLLRLLDLRRRAHAATCASGTSTGSWRCGRPRSRDPSRTSTGTPR